TNMLKKNHSHTVKSQIIYFDEKISPVHVPSVLTIEKMDSPSYSSIIFDMEPEKPPAYSLI
ncbi:hypothetical protein PMAYCL1PPCAC_33132, partial [Pristionchus mayeri]